jgi:hypothetical protein
LETKPSLDRSVRICSHWRGPRNTVVSIERSDGDPRVLGEREKAARPRFRGNQKQGLGVRAMGNRGESE